AGVFFGEHVTILFDDIVVARVTAPNVAGQSASGAVAFNGAALPAAEDSTTVSIEFTVPEKAAVGTHIITAVGGTFTCFCNPRGEFTVLAAGGTGGLARTGVEAGLVIVVALALLLVGRALVTASRQRRRGSLRPEHERNLTDTRR